MAHPLTVARERRSISQEELERRSGVSQAIISRLERGVVARSPHVGLLPAMQVARFVGSTVEELFADDLEAWKRTRAATNDDAAAAPDPEAA